MARCGCASDRCTCNFIAGDNVAVSGTGSRSNPYVFTVVLPEETGGSGGGTPVSTGRLPGEIIAYGGATVPEGWLLCDGSLVGRAQFDQLFATIGTAYGPGDGLTTFKLPNLVGKFPLGVDSGHPRGSTGGSDGTVLQTRHLPQHSHNMAHTHTINHDHTMEDSGNHEHNMQFSNTEGDSMDNVPKGTTAQVDSGGGAIVFNGVHKHNVLAHNGNSGASSKTDTGNAGSASPDEINTMPPYTSVNYLICTG